uniref:IraD/Gp25-like domain-containing protein n=1 Tax=Candidatus Kentrum sp. LFY TaxID=2126342 RepID=A0A450WH03_9GAMM|nr:MAG: hypothetical protein BECKLFY1418C_GA0070996_102240 [Candidatus Kentron sp. LFY]
MNAMSTAPPTGYDLSPNDWQPALDKGGVVEGVDDIDQCVRTILLTPKGADPHRPAFGSEIHDYVDWPPDRATPHLVRETVRALRAWEPRISEVDVVISHTMGHVTATIRWVPKGDVAARDTDVRLSQ